MAHILELSDGSTTVSFVGTSGTAWCLIEDSGLHIGMPAPKVAWTGGYIGYSGSGLSNITYENRTIEITFEIVGDDFDDVADKLVSVRRLINQATESIIRPQEAARVYLKYQIDTLSNPVYFDVITGELRLPDNIMSLEALNWMKNSSQKTIKGFTLTLSCKPFARGAEVLLASANDTLGNTNDLYWDNGVTLSGSSINGDSPGPLRVVLEGNNTYTTIRNPIWVGIKRYCNETYFLPTREAEYADYVTLGGSLTSKSVAYSGDTGDGTGGYAVNYTISSTDEEYIGIFSYGSAQAPYNKGKARVLAIGSFSNECKYRIGIKRPDNTLSYFPWVRPAQDYHATENYIMDMGVIDPIPMTFMVGDDISSQDFLVCVQADDSGSKSIRFDALQMIPAEDYCYRKIIFTGGFGPSSNGVVAEDFGIRDVVYYASDSPLYYFQGTVEGLPLHVLPGVDHSLYVIVEQNGKYDPSMTSALFVYHTPYYFNVRGTE